VSQKFCGRPKSLLPRCQYLDWSEALLRASGSVKRIVAFGQKRLHELPFADPYFGNRSAAGRRLSLQSRRAHQNALGAAGPKGAGACSEPQMALAAPFVANNRHLAVF